MFKKARLITWDGPFPELGNYLKTPAGSVYLVVEAKLNTRPNPKSVGRLVMLKLTSDEITQLDPNTDLVYFKWG